MKFKIFAIGFSLVLGLILISGGFAKDVGGPIVVDTVWNPVDNPFHVIRSVLVSEGVTLTIMPGVIVKFEPNLAFQVDGQLIAQGTESKIIIFTSNKSTPAPGDWGYVYFSDTSVDAVFDGETYISGCIMQYCAVEYSGGTGAVGAVYMLNSSPYIDHSIIRNNAKSGIYVSGSGSKPKINLNRIEKNSGSGIYVYSSTATITGNSIVDNVISQSNGAGIYFASGSVGSINSNLIANNKASGGGNSNTIYIGTTPSSFTRNSLLGDDTEFTIFYDVPHGNTMNAENNFWGT